jgi:MOSC domain-containing protein YiiM
MIFVGFLERLPRLRLHLIPTQRTLGILASFAKNLSIAFGKYCLTKSMYNAMNQAVIALSISPTHTMRKENQTSITLQKGLGVEGDAHKGVTVKHRSRVAQDPTQPNLRQVHLIHSELHEELKTKGFAVEYGQMGENITTQGIDLLGLPRGTQLRIGEAAVVEVTGLRNPCHQLNGVQEGLLNAVLDKDEAGNLIRKAGIMGIVLEGGVIKVGDAIQIMLPPLPHLGLERV